MHRFAWDLHYPPPDALEHEYPISAIYMDTPRLPLGPTALPGAYTVKLTVNGTSHAQPLIVKMDPPITTAPRGLKQQFTLATRLSDMMNAAYAALDRARRSRESTGEGRPSTGESDLAALNNDLATAYGLVEEVDATPTSQMVRTVSELQQRFARLLR